MPSKRAEAAKTAASPRKRASEPIEDVNEAEVEASSTVKRRKGLGVRVIGCRIYDSENGKTCHQCRQKTMDLMASCKNASGSRPCSQHFCSKCLLNRYGEKVTEVSQISLWSCPRCRGICNCSICLKKQGRVPTGILVHAAKATGCTSVAELLKKCSAGGVDQVKVPLSPLNDDFNKDENVIQDAQLNGEKATSLKSKKRKHSATYDGDQVPSDSNIEPKKDVISVTALKTVTGRKLGTLKAKNGKLIVSVDGNVEGPVANALLRMSPKRPKKLPTDVSAEAISFSKVQKHKSEPQKGKSKFNPNGCVSALKNVEKTLLTNEDTVEDSQIQKDSASEDFIRYPNKEGNLSLSVKSKKEKSKAQDKNTNKHSTTKDLKSVTKEQIKGIIKEDAEGECPLSENKTPAKKQTKRKEKQSKEEKIKVGISTNSTAHGKEQKRKGQGRKIRSKTEEDVVLPQGEALLTVAGMDLPAEAVGPAIQFIEFCLAFQPVLGLRRGDAEAVLRELTKGRLARKGCNSMLIQLQTKLLKIIESSYSDESVEVTESSSGSKSWLNILKKHLNERSPMFSSLDGDEKMAIEHKYFMGSTVVLEEDLRAIKNAINEGADSYENLSLYHKLQLLVILSDDSLETQSMRNHMESVNREYNEALKGNREEVQAARKEMRDARQKIKDAEVAKLIALGGVNGPLSHKEQEAILKRVQVETEIAITAASLEKAALSRIKKGRNDAIRAEAITWAPDGRVFYRLKGVANMGCVIVQECKVGQGGLDSWKVYSDAEEADLTKHLVQRAKMACKKRRCETNKKKCTTEIVEDEKENIVPNSVKKE